MCNFAVYVVLGVKKWNWEFVQGSTMKGNEAWLDVVRLADQLIRSFSWSFSYLVSC